MITRPHVILHLSFLLLAWSIIGCGSLPNGRGWGQDATLTPGWGRIGQAAWNAAASPATWGPAAGALAFQVGNADLNLALWAMEHTPLYGSPENAAHASDILSNVVSVAYVGTAFATPSGDEPGEWALSKAKGFAVGYSAVAINSSLTGLLKDKTARTRPNGQDTQSFPSNHASKAGVYATLADRNVETMAIPENMVIASRIFLVTLTTGVSWARLEAGSHYPSDVLAGVAMGHFIGAFINDAFLGIEKSSPIAPIIEPSRGGVLIGITIQY
jgi:membrane-associated phospholipid phosphatase